MKHLKVKKNVCMPKEVPLSAIPLLERNLSFLQGAMLMGLLVFLASRDRHHDRARLGMNGENNPASLSSLLRGGPPHGQTAGPLGARSSHLQGHKGCLPFLKFQYHFTFPIGGLSFPSQAHPFSSASF